LKKVKSLIGFILDNDEKSFLDQYSFENNRLTFGAQYQFAATIAGPSGLPSPPKLFDLVLRMYLISGSLIFLTNKIF